MYVKQYAWVWSDVETNIIFEETTPAAASYAWPPSIKDFQYCVYMPLNKGL